MKTDLSSYRIAIIIINWNGKKDTLSCLSSLTKLVQTKTDPVHHIYVVDHNSQDGSPIAIMKQFPEVTLLQAHKNLGFAEGNNFALRKALQEDFTHFFLLNNDTEVDPLVLRQLMQKAETNPSIGIVGPSVYRMDDPKVVDHCGGKWVDSLAEFRSYGKDLTAVQEQVDYVSGCAMLIKEQVFYEIGLFDPAFFLIWEESDLCMRAKKQGFLIVTEPKAKIWHKISSSFSSKALMEYYWWRNRLYFLEKHFPEKKAFAYQQLQRVRKHWFLKQLQKLFYLAKGQALPEKKQKALHRMGMKLLGAKHYKKKRMGAF